MNHTLSVVIPDEIMRGVNLNPDAFMSEMRVAAAVKWYELGRISQSKAAEVAGISRSDFIDALALFGVSPFQVTPDELEAELTYG